MGKKKDTSVSDASDNRDQVVTADELVTEPEASPAGVCKQCTADVVDGVCVNCGTSADV